MRPVVRFLGDDLADQIIGEARNILCQLGMEIHNDGIVAMLSDHGARVDREKKRVHLTEEIIDRALQSAPTAFKLYDVLGQKTHDFSGQNVHFTPGSAAVTTSSAGSVIATTRCSRTLREQVLQSFLQRLRSASSATSSRTRSCSGKIVSMPPSA